MTAEPISSVLVHVGRDRVGDSLLKLPFVQELRAAFPEARITWLAGKDTSAYATAMAPLVSGLIDEIIEYGGIGERLRDIFQPTLAGQSFDLVIDTQNNIFTTLCLKKVTHKTFISPAGFFLLSTVRPRRGYRLPENLRRQMLDLLELATAQHIPSPDVSFLDIPQSHRDRAIELLPEGPAYSGFAPGYGVRSHCWPLENFIDWAKTQVEKDRTPVALIGPGEPEWISVIRKAVPETLFPLQASGYDHGFDPLYTIALGERLTMALANDSAAGHMLSVSGIRLISLLGDRTPLKYKPAGPRVTVMHAHDFGGKDVADIPLSRVLEETDATFGKFDGR